MFHDVLNKKRNYFRVKNYNFSEGQKSHFSKGKTLFYFF